MEHLRHTLLRPLQILLHLLRILIALRQSGAGPRDALLSQSLQILQFAGLRIQDARSADKMSESFSL